MTRIDPHALRLAAAYQTANKPTTLSPTAALHSASSRSFDPLRRADAVVDQVAIARPEKLAASVGKLAAGTVAGSAVKQPVTALVSGLPAGTTYTSRGTLVMHAQPGERNSAATGVALGRVLDAQG